MSIVRAKNWTTGGEPLADFKTCVCGRFRLAEQVIGDGQAEQLLRRSRPPPLGGWRAASCSRRSSRCRSSSRSWRA